MANAKPLLLNNVSSTVQAGSTAIGSASATGIVVATGDGANFGALNTDEFVPAVIVDTSTSPETIKEYVYVTARATDTLTVVRQAEDASRFAASTTSIQAGYTIAAIASRAALELEGDLRERYFLPDGAFAESFPRTASAASTTITSGTLWLAPIALPANVAIGHLAFISSSTGAVAPTHWWFGLYDKSRVQLATTSDQGSAAWGSFTLKSLAVATTAGGAASSFTTTYSGLYYVGMVMAATTPVNLLGVNVSQSIFGTTPPILGGTSDTAQTTPPAFPHTAGAITPNNALYAYVAA
jgi:hypothetical protein